MKFDDLKLHIDNAIVLGCFGDGIRPITDAILQTIISSGFAIVPLEPTEKMVGRGIAGRNAGKGVLDTYKTMIGAYNP